jgi:hypothetical protein
MRRLALLVVSLALAIGSVAWILPVPVVFAQSGYAPDAEEWAFVELLNAYRGGLGLGPVTLNYELGAAAEYHSVDMATNNYFDHYSINGTDPGTNIQNFGYTGFPYSENIAAGMSSAQEVLSAWQGSPDHNATMTNPQYTEIGIGRHYVEGSQYGWYWTATYGAGEAPQTAPEPLPAPVEVSEPLPAPVEVSDPTLVMETTAPETVTTVIEAPSVTTTEGGVVELEQPAINADGDRAVSTGADPVADGTGDTYIVGDINTGGIQGQTIVYEEPSLNVSGNASAPAPAPATTSEPVPATTSEPAPVIYSDPAPAPAPATVAGEPVYTDTTFTETTTTVIEMNPGNGQARG